MNKKEIKDEFLRLLGNMTHFDEQDEVIQEIATSAGEFFYGKIEGYLSPDEVREFFIDAYTKMGRPKLKRRR